MYIHIYIYCDIFYLYLCNVVMSQCFCLQLIFLPLWLLSDLCPGRDRDRCPFEGLLLGPQEGTDNAAHLKAWLSFSLIFNQAFVHRTPDSDGRKLPGRRHCSSSPRASFRHVPNGSGVQSHGPVFFFKAYMRSHLTRMGRKLARWTSPLFSRRGLSWDDRAPT